MFEVRMKAAYENTCHVCYVQADNAEAVAAIFPPPYQVIPVVSIDLQKARELALVQQQHWGPERCPVGAG